MSFLSIVSKYSIYLVHVMCSPVLSTIFDSHYDSMRQVLLLFTYE